MNYDLDLGLYASVFLKVQGHQGISSSVKGTQRANCKFLLEHLKGTKAMTWGMEAIAFGASLEYQACGLFHFTE